MDLERIKNTAIGAAYDSAAIINGFSGRLTRIAKKGPIDLVTEADIASEKNIIAAIRSRFPDHDILAEESGLNRSTDATCQWIVDPLDGTTNFAHQIPVFAVSIAFASAGEILVGIVLNPATGDLFTAIRGQGAMLNNQPIRVSEEINLADSLLATGFPYDVKDMLDPVMERLRRCVEGARGIRRLGSAALDLCFVACGRFAGFWEENLKPWDTAAGWLIAEEAGAQVTDFSGRPYGLDKNQILAASPPIHPAMKSLLEI
ncbi:MAG: inositol monophosphatase [Desulfobacterales bacterium CG23_combo_of_CG06-09_8_20_14_all_51_8]|nr:MAG: inositol monophosphatase [Desulfobacterales bacterium CG23_combo_of_CG06-09_8_20_14_all_51_8]